MKKRTLIWLSVLLSFSGSVAALWWAQNFWLSDPAPQANEPNINSSNQDSQKSPVLGKEISGLPEYCADKLISVSGCDGMTEITSEQGNTYQLVEIGDQCWFADNLKETPTTDKGWNGYYDDAKQEPTPGEGMLYTWEAAMNGASDERSQGICPTGWHVPTYCEAQVLTSDVSIQQNFPGYRGITLARNGQPKAASFRGRSILRYFWTSSFHEKSSFAYHSIKDNANMVSAHHTHNAYSVQCIKD